MFITLKNENGTFNINGNSSAKLLSVDGLGLPTKTFDVVSYEGQPGQTTISETDKSRTITMSFDLSGDKFAAESLYKILYKPVEISFISGYKRRAITGRVSDMDDLQQVILGQMWNATIQFICDNPYFEDLSETVTVVCGRTDNLPNYYNENPPLIQLPAVATYRVSQKNVLNCGDVNLYPVIYIENNGETASDGVVITNITTQKTLKLNYAVPVSGSVTIDVPGRKIYDESGNSLLTYLDDETQLKDFELIKGENNISVSESAATSAQLQCLIKFKNTFITAVI